jgi:hypothetical protein
MVKFKCAFPYPIASNAAANLPKLTPERRIRMSENSLFRL